MTIAIKIGVVLACLLFICIQARYQAKRFKQQKTIEHWGKAAIFGLFVALLTVCCMFGHWHEWKTYTAWFDIPLLGTVTRIAFFDPILNPLRSPPQSLFYNGPKNIHQEGQSLQDWIENKLSTGWVKALKIFYIAAFVAALIFI